MSGDIGGDRGGTLEDLDQGSNWGGGDRGFGHWINGIFEKSDHWTNFEKQPIYSGFFDFLRHFKHNYTIIASTFSKLDDFSLKYGNLSKFLAPVAPKIGHWTQFFPKIFKSSPFSAPSAPKKWSPNGQSHPPPFLGGSPPQCDSWWQWYSKIIKTFWKYAFGGQFRALCTRNLVYPTTKSLEGIALELHSQYWGRIFL